MPVLRQPRYLAQPIPWDELEGEAESFNPHLPINGKGRGIKDEGQSTGLGTGDGGNENSQSQVPNPQSLDPQKIRKEGYEAGYRDGFMAGQQEGYRQGVAAAEELFKEQQWQTHQHIQQLLNNMAEAIRNEIADFFSRAEEVVTELALEIARKIIEVETKTNPEVIRRAVAQALQQLKSGTITLRLHPEDFSLIGGDLSSLNLGDGVSVRLVPDETVERGGVIAESEQGFIDLQPRTKLALLQSEVL